MQRSMLSRRDFLRAAASVTVGLMATACAPAVAPTGGDTGAAPAAERASLIFWAPKHFITEQNDFFTESLQMTADTNSFDVEVQLFPWGEYHQKQNAAIEAGTLPDALLGISVSRHHAMGILADVSDLFAEIGESGGGWYESDVSEVTIDGKQYGIPFHNEPQVMYYRNDVFQTAGFNPPFMTWDELVTAAEAVTDPAARMWGFGNPYTLVPDGNNFTLSLIFTYGGRIQNEAGEIVINSPETVEALAFQSAMLNEHNFQPSGVTGWDDTGNNTAFLSGQVASVHNSGSVLNAMREDDPGWLETTVLGPLPGGPDGPKVFQGGSTAGVFVSSPYPEEAKRLIAGTMTPERYAGNMQAANGMFFPTLQNYTDLPIYTEDPWNGQIVELLPYAFQVNAPGSPTPWIDEVNAKFLFAELISRIAVDDWAIEEALADFEKQAQEIKQKYAEA